MDAVLQDFEAEGQVDVSARTASMWPAAHKLRTLRGTWRAAHKLHHVGFERFGGAWPGVEGQGGQVWDGSLDCRG